MQKTPRFLITDFQFPDIATERRIIENAGGDLAAFQCKTERDVIAVAGEADALLVQWAPITRAVIDHLPNCKVIVRYGIGLDNIDLDAAARPLHHGSQYSRLLHRRSRRPYLFTCPGARTPTGPDRQAGSRGQRGASFRRVPCPLSVSPPLSPSATEESRAPCFTAPRRADSSLLLVIPTCRLTLNFPPM